MAHRDGRARFRDRVREGGGWYRYLNDRLISVAGPASVGPYETTPEPSRQERPCPLCHAPMSHHSFDRTGAKPRMFCPTRSQD